MYKRARFSIVVAILLDTVHLATPLAAQGTGAHPDRHVLEPAGVAPVGRGEKGEPARVHGVNRFDAEAVAKAAREYKSR